MAQPDTSHFFKDEKGNPISLLSDPLAYIKAIGSAAMAHVAGTAEQTAATPAVGVDPTQLKHQANDVTSINIASQLASYSRGMNDKTSKAFIQTLDQIEDPDLRHKVMAQFQVQTGQSLEGFINGNKDWNNNGDHRDKTAALQLISSKRDDAENNLAKLTPQERAKKEDEADKIAIEIVSSTSGHDHSDANMQKVFRGLGGRTPEEIELIRSKVRSHTDGESNLYQKIDDGTHKGDEDEAVAMLAGDRVASAHAALANEDDPKRLREVVTGLKPDELEKLRADPDKAKLLARIENPSDRAEIDALLNNNKAGADAEHLGNLFKPKKEGMAEGQAGIYDKIGQDNYDRRKPANVLKELESMSGEDVKAAAAAWGKSHPGEPSFEAMLQTRWGDDSDKTEYNRILAMIHGDKGLNRSLRVQEGMREGDQDEIEAGLAHDKVDAKALASSDPDTRKKAETLQAENESFERNNVAADQRSRQIFLTMTGREDEVAVGRSTKDQLTAHYDSEARKDIGGSFNEKWVGGDAAKIIHADRQQKHDDKVRDDRVGAIEMLDDGKLSTETEVHRGKGAKEKAEALEGITNGKDLAKAQEQYRIKYGKEMLPYSGDERKDMNANELMIDNIRLYGVKAERPAKVEYLLQLQQYEKQYSKALEMDEAGEAGGGTQRWQRQELSGMRKMLKDPQFQAFDHQIVKPENGLPFIADNPNEPAFDQIETALPMKGEKVEDGLKDGVTKHDFSSHDKGMTEANKAEEGAKKRMADRIVKIFSTIAKIAAALTAQPELIALIDVAEGLIEMGVKWQVMGEAYDPAEDAKMLAITAAADIALMGFSKGGKLKGELAAAERQALGAGEKTAMEMEHAVSGEAKAEALSEGAHVAAGESSELKGAFKEGASAEKALGSEAATTVGTRVEQKAAGVAEGSAVHEGETAAVKTAESGAAKEALSPQQLAQQIEKRYGLAGAGSKMAIQTIGGGIVQGKSPSDVLKGLVTGGLGLILPGHLSEKVKGAIGNDSLAQKILGEVASFSTEFTANTTINVAGGGEAGGVMVDQLIGLGGSRVQRLGGGHAAPLHDEEQVHGEPTSGTTETIVEPTTTEPTSSAVAPLPTGISNEPVALAPAAPTSVPVHERVRQHLPAVNEPVQTAPIHERTTEKLQAVSEPAQTVPIHERTTQQMVAVNEPARTAPIHERMTEKLQAVEAPNTEPPAKVAEQERPQVEAKVDKPHELVDQVDEVTGVSKGPEYEKFTEDMKSFYANQEVEAQNVTEVATTRTEPRKDGKYYQADGKYDARTFTYDNANLTQLSMDVHLAAQRGVTGQDVEGIKQNAIKGVDDYYNFGEDGRLHTLPNGNKMQVEVNFVDQPVGADLVVGVQQPGKDPRTGQDRITVQNEWVTGTDPRLAAHEIGHQMGLVDEYVDLVSVNRDSVTAPGVKTDGSLMGNFYTDGLPTEVKQRSIDQIGNDITNAGHVTSTTSKGAPAPAPTMTSGPTALPTEPVVTTVPTHEAKRSEPVTTTKPLVISTDEGKMKAISAADETSGAKQPPSPEKVAEAVKWADDKLAALPKEGHMDRAKELELYAAGKIDEKTHAKHLTEFDGMDSFASSEAGKAAGLTSASTPDEIIGAAHSHLKGLNEQNYQTVQNGDAEHPAGVTADRLRLAVEGNENGERVPLTYKGAGGVNDGEGAMAQMREFQQGVSDIAGKNGISDMQVVQVGSGTTGWKNNPMKLLQHYGDGHNDQEWFERGAWTPKSDTDLAVFSDQAKVGAQEIDNPINADYGIFKTGAPGGKSGFANTDLGGDLFNYGKEWDRRAYDPDVVAANQPDGLFDFKLNISNDAFTTPPTMYTGPERETPAPGPKPKSMGDSERNRIPLTDEEAARAQARAAGLGMPADQLEVRSGNPKERTSWGQMFGQEKMFIADDVKPAVPTQTADGTWQRLTPNQQVSINGAIAHEVVGHREADLNGNSQTRSYSEYASMPEGEAESARVTDNAKDEAQASLRAAKFAPDLSNSERKLLFKDAMARLAKLDMDVDDVPGLGLALDER